MRTDATDGLGGWPARLRSGLGRARRWLAGLGLVGRLAVAVGLLAALAALGQLASRDGNAELVWLYDNHRFAPEEAGQIVRALGAKAITAQAVSGRIEVARDDLAAAHVLLDKAGLAPQSPRALLDAAAVAGLLPTRAELEQHARRQHERFLQAEIREIDDSLAATVRVHRSATRGLVPVETVRVTVELEVAEGRPISPQLIDRIQSKLLSLEPDLAPEGLTIIDSKGEAYLLADDPELVERSRIRAREEALGSSILEQLDWIPGVRVQVRISPAAGVIPPPEPPPQPPAPAIAVNAPLEEIPATEAPEEPPPPQATVVVRVPNTYYRQQFDLAANERRLLTDEEMTLFVSRIEDSIRSAVALAVPDGELGELFIDRIYELPPAGRPAPAPRGRDLGRWWWVPAVAAGALVTVAGLAALGRRLRRVGSGRRAASAGSRRRVRFDEAAGAAERARDLVRLDTAAAAGILQRWIGEAGGRDA